MRQLFIVDPLPGLSVTQDTTVVFMREAARRGHEVWACCVEDLVAGSGGGPEAGATRMTLLDPPADEHWYRTESYSTMRNGKMVRKTRRVTETEWWDLSGRHHEYHNGHRSRASSQDPTVQRCDP